MVETQALTTRGQADANLHRLTTAVDRPRDRNTVGELRLSLLQVEVRVCILKLPRLESTSLSNHSTFKPFYFQTTLLSPS